MLCECAPLDALAIHTSFRTFVRILPSRASSAIPKPESFASCAGEKTRCGVCGRAQRTFYFYTKRFAFCVGRRCREAPLQVVARELHLDWRTVKELNKVHAWERKRNALRATVRWSLTKDV